MDFVTSRAGAIISLLVFLSVPAIITGLQITYSVVNTILKQYPILMIAFSTIFYVFMTLVPALASLYTDRLSAYWFLMLVLLYLLWSTLLYVLGQALWSYLVLLLTVVFAMFVVRPLFKYAHVGLFALYVVAILWLLALFGMQTAALFQGQY
jgi:hypothetical protein